MRIGILDTNTDVSAFATARPDDGEKFRLLLSPLRPEWQFSSINVKKSQFPNDPNDFDGYVVTGSPASTNESLTWLSELRHFIRGLDDRHIPTVGICFGHQIIAQALGGSIGNNPGGWGFGVAKTDFTVVQAWMVPARPSLKLYAAHSEQVLEAPESAKVLGGNDFCPIASFCIGNHIFTTEYHPEMTRQFVSDLSYEIENEIGPEIAGQAREQFKKPADGAVFAQWMVRFLEMPR